MKPSKPANTFTGRSILATLSALGPGEKGAFRGRIYTKVQGINGIGPIPGGLLRYNGRESTGHALLIRNGAGEPVNLLTLHPRFPEDRRQELLPLAPVSGTYIHFPATKTPPSQVLIVTADWYTAYLLGKVTGYAAVACLFAENMPKVLSTWSSRGTEQSFWVCFDGSADDIDNPELIALTSLFENKSARLHLIPSGAGRTFLDVYKHRGYAGLAEVVYRAREAKSPPFLKYEKHPELGVKYLPLSWPSPVAGQFLLMHLRQTLSSFISMTPAANLLVALWIIRTYASTCFRFSPVLAIGSPELGCGKSTTAYLLQFLCRRAHGTSFIGSANLKTLLASRTLNSAREFRAADHETLILDEAQDIFNDRKVVAALRTTFDRLSLEITTSTKYKMAKEGLQGSVVLAYRADSLPESLASRSVHIQLQRLDADQELLRQETLLDESVQSEFMAIRAMMRRWVEDNSTTLSQSEVLSLGLKNPRANDVFMPLLAIARAINSDVVEEAVNAATASVAEGVSTSPGLQLLWEIRNVMHGYGENHISTADLVGKLKALPDSPWAHLNSANLWRILGPYGLSTANARIGKHIVKRFHTSALQVAFSRYLPDAELPDEATTAACSEDI